MRFAELTSLKVGGTISHFAQPTDEQELYETLRSSISDAYILGGGSNLVAGDQDFAGTVIRLKNTGITSHRSHDRPHIIAEAGVIFDELIQWSLAHGFSGLECLSGIPGTVGGAAVQNVGAYGRQLSDVLKAVRVLDRTTMTFYWLPPQELALRYRSTIFKRNSRFIVTAVDMWVSQGPSPVYYGELANSLGITLEMKADPVQIREHVLRIRGEKGMVLVEHDHDTWSAGSFFTNPILSGQQAHEILAGIQARTTVSVPHYIDDNQLVKLSAGWLIEQAGFTKGYPGDNAPARLSTKHALAITNRGHATAADIIALARQVADGVVSFSGIRLEPEPVFLGCSL